MVGVGVGDGFGYLLLGGNLSTRIAPHGEAPVATSQHQNLRGLRKIGRGQWGPIHSIGQGRGRGLSASLKFATSFFFFKKTPEYTPSPNTMNTELAHWGPAPAWGQGSRLMHFGRQGGTWLKVLGSCRAHSTR